MTSNILSFTLKNNKDVNIKNLDFSIIDGVAFFKIKGPTTNPRTQLDAEELAKFATHLTSEGIEYKVEFLEVPHTSRKIIYSLSLRIFTKIN